MVALESDVGDVQGGTTQEGIHMGVMAGTLDLIQRAYVGAEIRDGVLHFDPKPVGNLDGLSFPMRFHGRRRQADGFRPGGRPLRRGSGRGRGRGDPGRRTPHLRLSGPAEISVVRLAPVREESSW